MINEEGNKVKSKNLVKNKALISFDDEDGEEIAVDNKKKFSGGIVAAGLKPMVSEEQLNQLK